MLIKEVADKLNISPRAIRFYEEKGLLTPAKQKHNRYRTFTEQEIWRLQTIISLREAGMPIAHIRKALDDIDDSSSERLQDYLELQRSVMTARWLEIKQVIETTDHMIELLKQEKSLPLAGIYRLAEASKSLRDERASWKDKWDFDRLAGSHDARVASNSGTYANYEEALALIGEWVSPAAGEFGLDIGTGTGNLAGKLIGMGAHMSGVDQSREMLRRARSKYCGLETRLGNFLAVPYLDSQFDFVVSSFAFHHLTPEQQLLALAEMRRVLKPSGRICIANAMRTALAENGPAANGGEISAEHYPLLPDLLEWFSDNGFRTKLRQFNSLLHVVLAY